MAELKKKMDEQIVWIGENTVIDLDIHGLVPSTVYQVTEGEEAAVAVRFLH